MSTISGLGGANRSWDSGQTRKAEHEAKMFAKVDSDGSGSVDATELAAMLKHGDASSDVDSAALLKQMDSDGNGSLSSDELSKGMHDLMPRPASTMDFAQSRGAANDDSGGDGDAFTKLDTDGDGQLSRAEFEAGKPAQGPHGAGGPPPTQAGSGSGTSTSSTSSTLSASFDPLDVNQDGTVSEIERLAGQLKELAKSGSDGAAQGSNSEIAALAQKLYDQISKNWLQPESQTSQVSVTA